jgi:hypothetical protein
MLIQMEADIFFDYSYFSRLAISFSSLAHFNASLPDDAFTGLHEYAA